MADDVSRETLPDVSGSAPEDGEMSARLEAYIADGRAKMAAALQGQPFRETPSFDDLLVVGEAMLRHLLAAHPGDSQYAVPAQADPPIDPPIGLPPVAAADTES